jgi:DNA polymerase (family X)
MYLYAHNEQGTMKITTKEAAKYFGEIAGLLSLKGENAFKIKAYDTAIQHLNSAYVDLESFRIKIQNKEIKGFGTQLTAHIDELLEDNKILLLESLRNEIPEGLQEMLRIKGLSGKKIKIIHETLGIKTLQELKTACENFSLTSVKGFAEKTTESLLAAIEFHEAHKGMIRLSTHEEFLLDIQSRAKAILIPIQESIRKDETFSKISLLGITEEKNAIITNLQKAGYLLTSDSENILSFSISNPSLIIEILLTTPETFKKESFLQSAHTKHFSALYKYGDPDALLEKFSTEEAFYNALNIPLIPPELREGLYEHDLIKRIHEGNSDSLFKLNSLIEQLPESSDLKGILHVHSQYSDGSNSIHELAMAAKDGGYHYLGISDHSKSASYAGGLQEDIIKRQHEEIDILNEELAPFQILKGIESDILKNGDLDYSDSVLESFDFVIASIHSRFNQTRKEMTERILQAVKNPYTSILGHPTGRLLLERASYEFDLDMVIEACGEFRTLIEYNSNPKRLDIPWRYLSLAKKNGVKICITPDAHAIPHFDFCSYGILLCRKAGLFKEDIANTNSLENFMRQLKR